MSFIMTVGLLMLNFPLTAIALVFYYVFLKGSLDYYGFISWMCTIYILILFPPLIIIVAGISIFKFLIK